MLLACASISFLQAITNTTVSATTFTLSSIPFLTAIMAWLFLGERIGKSTVSTMLIAAVGISLMFVQGLGSGTLYGNFMAFLCAIGFSSYAIIICRNRRSEMLPTLILSNLIIMLVALIFSWDNLLISWSDLLLCFVLGGAFISHSEHTVYHCFKASICSGIDSFYALGIHARTYMGVDFCKRGAQELDVNWGKYCDIGSSF